MKKDNSNGSSQILIMVLIVIIIGAVLAGVFGTIMTGSMMGGMMGAGWLFMLLPIVLIIVIIYALLDRDRPSSYQPPYNERERESSVTILERRYARGEIPRDEYMRVKKDLLRK